MRDHSFFDRGDLKHKVGSQQPSIHNSCISSFDLYVEIPISTQYRYHYVDFDHMNDTNLQIAISI